MGLAGGGPDGDGRLEKACAGVEVREAVARAGDEAEELRSGVEKVEELGNEKEAECLGEVAEDTDDGKDHSGEVAVGVTDEYLGGIPVMVEESEGDAQPGEEEIEREQVGVCCWMGVWGEEVEAIVEDEEEGDDDALRDFDAVDAGKHVDALGAEHGDAGHVDVVEDAEVEELPEIRLQRDRHHDRRDAEVDKVYDENGDACEARDPPLVSPSDVEEVVANSEQGDGLEGDDGG
jgi:hypothetical protein